MTPLFLRRILPGGVLLVSLTVLLCLPSASQQIVDLEGVGNLQQKKERDTVLLTWSSDPQETFAVVCRSAANWQTPWVLLAAQVHASAGTNRTTFVDGGALTRTPAMRTIDDLTNFYRVFVIPDFWFNLEGVKLSGGPRNPGEDFLPLYRGNREAGIFRPVVEMLVDGNSARVAETPEQDLQRVNFATVNKPRWEYTAGNWFHHDHLTNGEHTLQLVTRLALNNSVGDYSWTVTLTNAPKRVWLSHQPGRPIRSSKGPLSTSNKLGADSWWVTKLGPRFVRKRLSPDEWMKKAASSEINPLEQELQPRPWQPVPLIRTSGKNSMQLELGPHRSKFVPVSPAYSNAVLQAALPYISDSAQALDIQAVPVTASQVAHCSIRPDGKAEAEIGLDNGWAFAFVRGFVRTIQSSHSYSVLQNPEEIPRFFGELRMTKSEAVQLARESLKKLKIPLESVFAEQKPQVDGPHQIGTNIVPHYCIKWPDPRGSPSVEIEVNGNSGRVERIRLSNRSLDRPLPKLDVELAPSATATGWPQVNPSYAEKLIPLVLKAVDDYTGKLQLPVPRPLTTNHAAHFKVEADLNSPRVELDLTNGWRFEYSHSMVNGFNAPDDLFSTHAEQRSILIKDFTGKWNLSEAKAKELVRQKIALLNYPTNLVHFEVSPQVQKPAIPGIPRYMFFWNYSVAGEDTVRSAVRAEVDADKGELKSLFYSDLALYNHGPDIDLPILLPDGVSRPTDPFALPTHHRQPPPSRPIPSVVPPVR